MVIQIRKQEPQFNLLQKITLFLLILAGMDLLNQYKTIAMLACIVFLVFKVRFVINADVLWLLLLAISWAIFSPEGNGAITYLLAPFIFPLAYLVGLNFLPADNQEKAEKNLRMAIIIVSVGPFIHFILNFLYNFGKNVERNTDDFWTNQLLSATVQASMALMMVTVSIIILFTNARARNKMGSVIVLAAIFLYNLTLAGRTFFVMLMLIFAVSLVFLMWKGKQKSKKYKTLLIVAIIILILSVLYNANAFGIQDTIESSNFYERFFGQWGKGLDEDSRLDAKLKYLGDFDKGLWGGIRLRPLYGYAHDILLDTYDEAGIFALVAMFVFLFSAIVRLFSCLKNRSLKFETQQWIFGMYVAILVQFMVEPILQGMHWMFMLFCFIHGMVTRLDKISRQNAVYLIAKESQSNTTEG